MQVPEDNFATLFPAEMDADYFNQPFLPSTLKSEDESTDFVDLLLESFDDSGAFASNFSQWRDETFGDHSSTSQASEHHSQIASTPPTHAEGTPSSEGTVEPVRSRRRGSTPGSTSSMDRQDRRRQQNRIAQGVFRQKRKEEVRRLEREIAELRAQLSGIQQNAATAGWTICSKCSSFYPPSSSTGHVGA